MTAWWAACRHTAKLFGSQRRLWIPFLLSAVVELLGVGLVWLAPHPPFAKVLAPPIRFFFGEAVLHYPVHLWFLYHAMKHTHVLASIIAGAFLSALAFVMVRQAREGQPLSFYTALASRQVRFGRVTALWVIAWVVGKSTMETFTHFAPKTVWMAWSGIGLALVLQALLIYAIPFAVFEGATWLKALLRGIRETLRYPVSTFAILLGPSAVLIAFNVCVPSERVGAWMTNTTNPEIVLAFIAARLAVWMIADGVLTIAISHLWWSHRAAHPSTAASSSIAQATTRSFKEGPAVA